MGRCAGLGIFSFPFKCSYLTFSDSMPNNPDKNHIAIQLISFPLRMQPPVHPWKADTVARQPLPGGWEVGSGEGGCFRKKGGMLPDIQQVMAGMVTDICKNLHLCFNSQHKDREKLWLPVWWRMGESGSRLSGRNRQVQQGVPLLPPWIIHSVSYTCMN